MKAVFLRLLCVGFLASASSGFAEDADRSPRELQALLDDADKVLGLDNVSSGAQAGKIFAAAHALLKAGEKKRAADYFGRALQRSPWNLKEQLAYAELLLELDRKPEAMEAAQLVDDTSESDDLCNQARKILGTAEVKPAPAPVEMATRAGPWVCLVQLDPVNKVVLAETVEKLHATLGIAVFVYPYINNLGKPNRSAFSLWVQKEVIPRFKWESPQCRSILRHLDVDSPNDARPSLLMADIYDLLEQANQQRLLSELKQADDFFHEHDKQWDANELVNNAAIVAQGVANAGNAIMVGITERDIYGDKSNFLFGNALVGRRRGLVSYARYRAEFYGDPPNRERLVTRMHKQLLSTVGFAVGVPRPTDPTSARSYSASLPEHDAKSEYMSEACIAGFEKALNVKLPEAARKPRRR